MNDFIIRKDRKIGDKVFEIYGDTRDDCVFNNIKHDLNYENHMIEFYKELLNKDSVCVDVGANIGILSFYMSLYTDNKIYAFEATKDNYLILKKNIEVNNLNVIPINKALGNKSGTKSFTYDIKNGSNGSFLPKNNPEELSDKYVKVDVITLDEFVEQEKIDKIDVLKMDVEGFETEVIEGAKNTIEKFSPDVITEYCPDMIEGSGFNSEEYYELLKKYYKYTYVITQQNMSLVRVHNYKQLYNVLYNRSLGFDKIGDVFFTNKNIE